MLGWSVWQRFAAYRLSRRNRRSLASIQAMLENDAVINGIFREMTIKRLDLIHDIVETIRDQKLAEGLAEADEKMRVYDIQRGPQVLSPWKNDIEP